MISINTMESGSAVAGGGGGGVGGDAPTTMPSYDDVRVVTDEGGVCLTVTPKTRLSDVLDRLHFR